MQVVRAAADAPTTIDECPISPAEPSPSSSRTSRTRRSSQRLGDDYRDVLTRSRIVRDLRCGGWNRDRHTGRCLLLRLSPARDAVTAAVGTQRAHAAETWPDVDVEVRVRIGLHTGEPTLHEEGYVGLDVVRPRASAPSGGAADPSCPRRPAPCSAPGARRRLRLSARATSPSRDRRAGTCFRDRDRRSRRRADRRGPSLRPQPLHRSSASSSRTSRAASTISARGSQPGSRSVCCGRSRGRTWTVRGSAVDDIATRMESLGAEIDARVQAALAKKGIPPRP